jgi:hypothetical protein
MQEPPEEDRVAALQRWADAGAIWRVIWRDADSATVSLYTCDGGEEVDRFTSSQPALLRYLDEHGSDER